MTEPLSPGDGTPAQDAALPAGLDAYALPAELAAELQSVI